MEHYNVELQVTSCQDKGADAQYTENNYTGVVTSDNEKGYIIVVISNEVHKDDPTARVITVQMTPVVGAPEENKADAGVWVKGEQEGGVQAILLDQNGKQVASSPSVLYS